MNSRNATLILALVHFAFGVRPGTVILVTPERSSRMNQENLKRLSGAPIHENTCARCWHCHCLVCQCLPRSAVFPALEWKRQLARYHVSERKVIDNAG
jgi:hypothetical protein